MEKFLAKTIGANFRNDLERPLATTFNADLGDDLETNLDITFGEDEHWPSDPAPHLWRAPFIMPTKP